MTVGFKIGLSTRMDKRVALECPPSHRVGSPIHSARERIIKFHKACSSVFSSLNEANRVAVPMEMIVSERD